MRLDYRLIGGEPTPGDKYNFRTMKAIVIIANGWHAGWLGCYGNEWLRTHNLDKLAAESIVFDQHFAVDPSLGGWFHSFATGRYPSPNQSLEPTKLFATLQNYGVRTVRVHDLKGPSASEMASAWGQSIAVPKAAEGTPGEAIFLQLDQVLHELADVEDWLLWIETDRFVPPWDVSLDFFDEYAKDMAFLNEGEEPHPWDEPPLGPREVDDRDFERLQSTFASIVTEWDVELAEWFALFREHKLDESAVWAVTSGYGLSLGEHGWIGPSGDRPFEELGHVPLLLRLPNSRPIHNESEAGTVGLGIQAGRRVSELTASIDLLPTILDAFGFTIPNDIHGKSLLPLAHGKRDLIHDFLFQYLVTDGRTERLIRTMEWASFHSSTLPPLLYRKPEDRWEVNNLRQQHLEWAEHLEAVSIAHTANPDALPSLKSYDDVVSGTTEENQHEHGTIGERNDRSSEGESDLRRHQSDQKD